VVADADGLGALIRARLSDNLPLIGEPIATILTEVAAVPMREVVMNFDKRIWYAIAAVIVILVLVFWARRQPTEPAATTAPAPTVSTPAAPAKVPAPAPAMTPAPETTPKQ
jgi:hypothetical protein